MCLVIGVSIHLFIRFPCHCLIVVSSTDFSHLRFAYIYLLFSPVLSLLTFIILATFSAQTSHVHLTTTVYKDHAFPLRFKFHKSPGEGDRDVRYARYKWNANLRPKQVCPRVLTHVIWSTVIGGGG